MLFVLIGPDSVDDDMDSIDPEADADSVDDDMDSIDLEAYAAIDVVLSKVSLDMIPRLINI